LSPAASSPGCKEHDQRDLVRDSIWRSEISYRQTAWLSKGDRTADDENRPGEGEREARKPPDTILKIVRGLGAVGWRSALQG
jgi:hypothetical protein